MFRRLETWHYKCLKRIDITLDPVNILIGPNASGKSTLLALFGFLQDALGGDVEQAVRRRANSLRELVRNQMRETRGFEMALEADIPQAMRATNGYDRVR